ncbi:MAG: PKD domain-containing protein [Candidatus Acetothermia bacterium]|jgi:PKD repeat protein|nr:PKD domain-containing protein [Candidatus Acetothermia bacterium]MDH7505506.1 PKD domain-containing protein [Candidatus Acetothermia bacterium]
MNRAKVPLLIVSLLMLVSLALILGGCAGNKPPTDVKITSPADKATLNSKVVEFKGTGTDPEKKALTYAWDFGDTKGKSTEQNPKYTYEKPGTYTVKFTVTDDKKAATTATITITVKNAKPVAKASANPTKGVAPLEVQFDSAGSSDPDARTGETLKYSWDFGDGAKDTTAKPKHTYQNPGTYAAKLTVTDADGENSDPVTVTITVEAPPPPAETPPAGS